MGGVEDKARWWGGEGQSDAPVLQPLSKMGVEEARRGSAELLHAPARADRGPVARPPTCQQLASPPRLQQPHAGSPSPLLLTRRHNEAGGREMYRCHGH